MDKKGEEFVQKLEDALDKSARTRSEVPDTSLGKIEFRLDQVSDRLDHQEAAVQKTADRVEAVESKLFTFGYIVVALVVTAALLYWLS